MSTGPSPPRAPLGALLVGLLAIAIAGFVGLLGLLGDRSDDGTLAPAPDDALATLGSSSDGYAVWARNDDGTPVRWDPCAPIDLVLADDHAPTGWRDDLAVALEELTQASGIAFRVLGATEEAPTLRRPAYQPDRYGERWAPVLVAWDEPGAGDLPLRTTDRGLAIPVAVGPAGDRTYVTGQVVFNRERDDLIVGFDDRATSWGATLLHEFGHLLGLAHADDPSQLMATYPGEGPVRLEAGDRAGLRAVGRAAGCRDAPEPQPVDLPESLTELDVHRSDRRTGASD